MSNRSESPSLIVGLGNPGREYEETRHNVGFMIVDEVARRFGVTNWRQKDQARQALIRERNVLLVEPTSYMNLSGVPVRLISSWYRTPPERILVISDDMDLPLGRLRMRPSGGHGGHNGLRSIIGTIGENFARLRVGVGRPEGGESIDYVLGAFPVAQRDTLARVIVAAADGAERWLAEGTERTLPSVNAFRAD
ncbi:MAG: aminoacyl-tRNA hydrolase [Candidatus Eremiobacteraeota bacterium]|nr:aminoacyl-tRNA hydrolase [Candidatus Eremiobacteraeota bacterium]